MDNSQRNAKPAIWEHVGLTLGVSVLFFFGYFAVGLSTIHRRAHDFQTPLDNRIPFVARSIWIYLWSFSASVIPLCFIRCPRLFRRSALAFAVAICVSLVCFTAFPVTASHLRVSAAQLKAPGPSHWAVSTIYTLDPPYNLFPSLHVSLTALAAMAVWKTNRFYGGLLFIGVASVAIAVCTTKQHFLFDVLGGLAIAALVGGIILVPFQRRDVMAAYTWRGPASYLASVAIMYLGFYAAYLWPR
jgi:PAP2 superfamily protein